MDRSGSRRGETDAEPPGVLRASTRHERGGFLVPYLQKRNAVLAKAQCLHDAVDTVAGQAEDNPAPQSISRSTNTSDVVLDMRCSWC
jgi:hypothetical protein